MTRSSPYVRRHPRRGALRFGSKRFGARGGPPRRTTRPDCGPLTTVGSIEHRRCDGTDRKGPEQSSGIGHEPEYRKFHRDD